MINRWKLIIFMQVSLYISINRGLTIRVGGAQDKNDDSSSEISTTMASKPQTAYRHTVAKVKDTQYRVPEHLQFVPKGFVYEDADDVIHVIDPPKQFEELKRIMQREQQQRGDNNKQQRPFPLKPQRPKPKIFKAPLPSAHFKDDHLKKSLNVKDLETQETQQLPVEILASVRKTEKYLKKFKPKLPLVKQRLKTKKIQTVIWEKSQAEQQYQHGQEQKLQGIREQLPATNQRRHYITKRFKREINIKNKQELKGEQLLQHINELIKNATFYLQLAEDLEDYKQAQARELATPTEITTLQDEILFTNPQTTTETAASTTTTTLSEDMVVKILENSVKATNVIMQQIKIQTNLTDISEKCDHLKVTYPNHIQNLQNQIKCMQNFIEDINHHPSTAVERLALHKSKDLRHKPFLVAHLGDDYIDDIAPTPVNTSLIYDDVMTTIRNMLLLQNLQSLEKTSAASNSPSWEDTPLVYDNSTEPVDFDNLQQYLSSLHYIVENLPKFSHKSLNLQEIEGGNTSKYYFINPQGTIYSLPQPFQKDSKTTPSPSTIFHDFPDLPLITDYLRNGTLLPPSRQVVEIL